MEIVQTACELCPWGCGMDVYLEGGRIVKVKGTTDHPLNRGALCPKGLSARDFVYSPERLRTPLMKTPKGFQPITWDEALERIAEKLQSIREQYGPKSLAVAIGMPILLGGNSTVSLLRRFCDVFGTPNCFSVESICYRPRIIAYILTFGKFPVADPENSRCIILWGHNPHASNPPLVKRILSAMKKGAKLIVIDPRSTPLAKRAHLHLRPKPGTDGALALGLIQVILSEGLYDEPFVHEWTKGFEELRDHVSAYTPERVEEITSIPRSLIQQAGRMFGTIKPACIVQGINALDQHASGLQNSRAIAILQAITANIDKPGGFITTSRVHLNSLRLPEMLSGEPLGIDQFPLFYEVWGRLFGEGQAMVLPDALLQGQPYPIRGMIVSASNPVLTWPNSKKVEASLKKIDFLVVMDLFMTETAKLADMVLPAASFLERTELCDYYGTIHGIPYVTLRKKVIDYPEAWPDLKFWFELAKRMGYEAFFPWKDVDEAIAYALKPSGLTLQQLMDHPQGLPFGTIRYDQYKEKGFSTPSKKIEIYSETLKKLGHDPLPTYRESPLSEGNLAKDYPLHLTTGARTLEYLHSELRNIPKLHKKRPEPLAEIDPETAGYYGIADEDQIEVETPIGCIKMKVHVTKDILPGVVNLPHGWAEANVNLLTTERPGDPISGAPLLKSIRCLIRRWKE
jgi:formate dehydrogenase (coenzyme F420) alpha subunit